MKEKNLSFKNIKEFTTKDTLYYHMTYQSRGMTETIFLCQFVAYDRTKGKVTAKIIEDKNNKQSSWQGKIDQGWEETFPVEKASLYGNNNETRERFHYFDPVGFAAYPTLEDKFQGCPAEHPSYGMISISKRSCAKPQAYFGSATLQPTSISISIHRAKLDRGYHEDRFHQEAEIMQLEMTPLQFSELLTSSGSQGVPATIRRIHGENSPNTPFTSKIEQFEAELNHKLKAIHHETKQTILTIQTLLGSPKAIGKKDREHLNSLLNSLNTQIENNLPFLQSQFQETMEKTVGEAKAGLNAYLQNRLEGTQIENHPQPINLLGDKIL